MFGIIGNYVGFQGYYNPFTTEAQYNAELPNTYIPFTLSHESAHQLGFAREQEATGHLPYRARSTSHQGRRLHVGSFR